MSIDDPGKDIRSGASVQVDCHLRNGALVSMTGTIVPKDRRDIEATVAGTVEEVLVAEGSLVEAGRLLVTLEQFVTVAYDQALTAYGSAKQTLATCENDIEVQRLRVEQARVNAEDRANAVAKQRVNSPIEREGSKPPTRAGRRGDCQRDGGRVVSVLPLTVVIPVDEADADKCDYRPDGQDRKSTLCPGGCLKGP